jgi:hypothetical protein
LAGERGGLPISVMLSVVFVAGAVITWFCAPPSDQDEK